MQVPPAPPPLTHCPVQQSESVEHVDWGGAHAHLEVAASHAPLTQSRGTRQLWPGPDCAQRDHCASQVLLQQSLEEWHVLPAPPQAH